MILYVRTTFIMYLLQPFLYMCLWLTTGRLLFQKKMAFSKYSGRAHTYAHTLQEYVLEFSYVCYIAKVKCLASDCVTIINWLIWSQLTHGYYANVPQIGVPQIRRFSQIGAQRLYNHCITFLAHLFTTVTLFGLWPHS